MICMEVCSRQKKRIRGKGWGEFKDFLQIMEVELMNILEHGLVGLSASVLAGEVRSRYMPHNLHTPTASGPGDNTPMSHLKATSQPCTSP